MDTSGSLEAVATGAVSAFSYTRKIRFGDTDSAGIVYYPNYFDMFNEVVEDWFEQDLGVSFLHLHTKDHMGIPMAHAECDFLMPCRLGESLVLALHVIHLGRTSMNLQIIGLVGEEVRLRANLVVVFVDLLTYKSIEPPAPLRALIVSKMAPAAN